MKQHHDVEVRRRCAMACHDPASQQRGSRVVVMLIYDGACGRRLLSWSASAAHWSATPQHR
ncbi:hypothetical protein ACVB8X_40905 [Streptomyces sp. NRAIS4]